MVLWRASYDTSTSDALELSISFKSGLLENVPELRVSIIHEMQTVCWGQVERGEIFGLLGANGAGKTSAISARGSAWTHCDGLVDIL